MLFEMRFQFDWPSGQSGRRSAATNEHCLRATVTQRGLPSDARAVASRDGGGTAANDASRLATARATAGAT
jgi:hypothetical protein